MLVRFDIDQPGVLKIPNSDAYIVFGLAQSEDSFCCVLGGDQGPTGTDDETVLDSIELVMSQVAALKEQLTMGGVKGPTQHIALSIVPGARFLCESFRSLSLILYLTVHNIYLPCGTKISI